MPRKQKSGELKRFQVRDTNGALMRDTYGRPVRITTYTLKAARHQAKATFQANVQVEIAS